MNEQIAILTSLLEVIENIIDTSREAGNNLPFTLGEAESIASEIFNACI